MGEFTGDDFFSCASDLMDFAGLGDEYYGEYDRLKGVNVFIKADYEKDFFIKDEFGDFKGLKKYFYDLAEEIGKPEQVFLNGRQLRYRMDE